MKYGASSGMGRLEKSKKTKPKKKKAKKKARGY